MDIWVLPENTDQIPKLYLLHAQVGGIYLLPPCTGDDITNGDLMRSQKGMPLFYCFPGILIIQLKIKYPIKNRPQLPVPAPIAKINIARF